MVVEWSNERIQSSMLLWVAGWINVDVKGTPKLVSGGWYMVYFSHVLWTLVRAELKFEAACLTFRM